MSMLGKQLGVFAVYVGGPTVGGPMDEDAVGDAVGEALDVVVL